MAKTRNISVPQTVRDGADDLSIRFYIADAAASPPNHARVVVQYTTSSGSTVESDRPLSDYSSLSGAQKTSLRALLTAIRDQNLALENFA